MNWAVLVAGGQGTRMGAGENKVFLPLGGIPAFLHSIRAFGACPRIAGLVLVLRHEEHGRARELLDAHGLSGAVGAIAPAGETRQQSVESGLRAVPEDADIVLVHDAARPLATPSLIDRVLSATEIYGCAIPALRVKDTVKYADEALRVVDTPAREHLWAVQTPQGFRAPLLREAHAWARANHLEATDDARLIEAMGRPVQLIEGEPSNIKLTQPEDLPLAAWYLGGLGGQSGEEIRMRVGQGMDVHRLVADRRLILCGVEIPFELGLLGHSDADVAAHAVSDALLGAAGLGDIGRHFPDTDEAFRDADSMLLLREVVEKIHRAGWRVGNVDVTLIAQRPKLSPYREAMADNLAAALGVPLPHVNVKATTTEGLGFAGRQEGICALASATLVAK